MFHVSNEEYVCAYAYPHQPLAGPFSRSAYACEFLDSLPDPTQWCVASRHFLASRKLYTRSKKGDAQLAAAVQLPAEVAHQFGEILGVIGCFQRNWEPEKKARARALLTDALAQLAGQTTPPDLPA